MKVELRKALENIQATYDELIDVANDMTEPYLKEIDSIVEHATNNINTLTNEDIRLLLLKLSLKSYSFSEFKDKSSLKSSCAEALKKEKLAVEFNRAEGSVAVRENQASINSIDEILADAVATLVSSLFKTKLDSVYRIVDTLKSVLLSRMSEAKLNSTLATDKDIGLQ